MDPRSDEELLAIVEAFVLRARRIESHSLMVGEDRWIDYFAAGTQTIHSKQGVISMEKSAPGEEALESLAGRVRPLILQDDPVQFGYVLKALSVLLYRAGDREGLRWYKELRRDWATLDPNQEVVAGVHAFISQDPALSSTLTDRELALSWFYGDFVHADRDRQRAAGAFDINERFRAAVVYVAQIAVLARDTHAWIRALCDAGTLTLSSEASEVAVKVESTKEILANIYFGEVEGPMPTEPFGPMPEGWSQITAESFGKGDRSMDITVPWGRSESYLGIEDEDGLSPPEPWCPACRWNRQLAFDPRPPVSRALRSRQARTLATS